MLAVALPSLADQYAGVFGGDQGLTRQRSPRPAFLGATFPLTRWQAWVTCACALIILVLLANLGRSRVGRTWRAVRDDEVAASLAGLNVARLQMLAFVVSAACAGLGGRAARRGHRRSSRRAPSRSPCPSRCSPARCSAASAACSARCGAASSWSWCPPTCTNVATSHGLSSAASSSVPIAAYGVVLIVVMLVFPAGIQGGLRRLLRPRRARRGRAASTPCAGAGQPANTRRKARHEQITSGRTCAAVAAVAAVAMLAAACGSSGSPSSSSSSSALTASAPGITATTITIGSHQPLTGVAAPGYDEIAPRPTPTSSTSTPTAASTAARSSTSTSTTSTTRPSPRPWCTSSCCRTTSTRSSTGWARPPTWPSRRT